MEHNDFIIGMQKEIRRNLLYYTKDPTTFGLQYRSGKNSPAIGWIIGYITGTQHFYLYWLLKDDPIPLPELDSYDTGTPSEFKKSSLSELLSIFKKDFNEIINFLQNTPDIFD